MVLVKVLYLENFKNIFDLYINNSTTDKKVLGSKVVDESMAEFALGQCAMVQNGNWAAGQILGVAGNKVAAEDIKFLPIRTNNTQLRFLNRETGVDEQDLVLAWDPLGCGNERAKRASHTTHCRHTTAR